MPVPGCVSGRGASRHGLKIRLPKQLEAGTSDPSSVARTFLFAGRREVFYAEPIRSAAALCGVYAQLPVNVGPWLTSLIPSTNLFSADQFKIDFRDRLDSPTVIDQMEQAAGTMARLDRTTRGAMKGRGNLARDCPA